MGKKEYVSDIQMTCGTPAESRSFRRITKMGVAVLMEIQDNAIESDEEDAEDMLLLNREIKGTHFRSQSRSAYELREFLHDYASDTSELGRKMFDEILYDAVTSAKATPLSYATELAKQVKLKTNKYSTNQKYSIWRLSHVIRMFQINDHLTYIDRRPYDTGFAIDGITDRESYEAYVAKYGYTMAAITYHALTDWYNKHPDFYRFRQIESTPSTEAYYEWIQTPAFYSTRELPITDDHDQTFTVQDSKGRLQHISTTHIGLATGKNGNFACYHGKTGPLKWNPAKESKAKDALEAAVREMKTQNPDNPCNESVDFALYFCSSRHQFAALFAHTKEKHKKGQQLPQPTSKPYASIHAIPVNDSGTFILWCLLEYGPRRTEYNIHSGLVNANIGFSFRNDVCYPMTFNGKPVFTGYTMDFFKINTAIEDYLDGKDFFVCCLPDQAPWYKALFPNCTIL